MSRCVRSMLLVLVAVGMARGAQKAAPLKVDAPAPVAAALRNDFQPVVEQRTGGEIDWTRGVVTAVGTARVQGKGSQAVSMAKRAARLVAARNAALLAAGVRAGPGGRFQNVKAGRIRIDALLSNFRQVRQTYDPKAGTVTTKIALPLHGIRGVATFAGVRFVKSDKRWDWPDGKAPGARADVVILDARGTGFLPSIAPRVVDPLGRCIFEGGDLEVGRVRTYAAVAYVDFKRPAGAKVAGKIIPPYTRLKSRARSAVEQANRAARERERLLREAERDARPRKPAKTPVKAKTLRDVVRKRFRSPLILQAGPSAKKSPDTLALSAAAVQALGRHPEAKTLFRTGKVVVVVDRVKAGE